MFGTISNGPAVAMVGAAEAGTDRPDVLLPWASTSTELGLRLGVETGGLSPESPVPYPLLLPTSVRESAVAKLLLVLPACSGKG